MATAPISERIPPRRAITAAAVYAVLGPLDVIFLHGLGHVAIVAALAAARVPLWVTVAGLFASLIVLGESLRIPGAGRLSLVHVLCALVILKLLGATDVATLASSLRRCARLRSLTWLMLWVVLLTVLGITRGNALSDVIETSLPFAYLGLMVVALFCVRPERLRAVYVVLLAAIAVAAIKASLLSISEVGAAWDNAWQAARDSIPGSPVSRVILRGGDIFLVLGVLFVATMLLFGRAKHPLRVTAFAFVFLPVLAVANFVSMTRSNYAGAAVGLLVIGVLMFWPRRHAVSRRAITTLVVAFAAACVVFVSLDRYFLLIDTFLARTGAATDNPGASLEWRAEESESIVAAIREHHGLGAGAGTRYVFRNAPDGLGTSIYSHNAYLWLLHHFGIVGLALFLSLTIELIIRGVTALRRVDDATERIELTAVIAGWTALAVLSITVNKVSSISGGFAWGLLAAALGRYGHAEERVPVAAHARS